MRKIHEFAMNWFDIFRNNNTTDMEIVENQSFADDCFSFEFKMDCGEAITNAFPEKNVFNDWQELDKVIDSIDDVQLIGSAIFSKWRYFNHWAGAGESITDAANRAWFITALGRLGRLTAESEEEGFLFSGKVRKMKLVSNCLGYGPCPEATDEVEQHLTITADGRVYYSDYCFGDGEKYNQVEKKNYKIDVAKAGQLLSLLENYFSNEFDAAFATDVGSWELVLTNTDDKEFLFRGSLCPIVDELIGISEEFRTVMEMPELLMFDGQESPDQIEALKIDYHRVTKIKPRVLPEDASYEYVTWDYSESILIDRATETLTHIQNVGSGCKIKREYEIEGGISSLLETLEEDGLFEYIEGNDEDALFNPLETKDYVIEVQYQRAGKRILTGTFDKNGLPSDFDEVADSIRDFMLFYGIGEILEPSVYGKRIRKKDELIFCNVEFGSGKTYCYLTDDDKMEPGDTVIVPVGADNKEVLVEIDSIEYHTAEDAPYPVDKIKHIIRRYENDE